MRENYESETKKIKMPGSRLKKSEEKMGRAKNKRN